MIKDLLDIFRRNRIPLTVFVTHESKIIEKEYSGRRRRFVGLHPNFLKGSTHGEDYMDIISNVVNIWGDARGFRSHSFYDHNRISDEFVRRGFKYVSNLSLDLQPDIVPLRHVSGIIRFPLFFEDYGYLSRYETFNFSELVNSLNCNGMKIFDFHPIHICMNTPSIDYYEGFKDKWNVSNWESFIYDGYGARSLLIDLLSFVRETEISAMYLDEVYEELFENGER